MKKPEIFFSPISGSSILSISWHKGPLGDAIEAKNGRGVGFFAHNGDLLSVQFDDVGETDHQILEFECHRIEVNVKSGKITFKLEEVGKPKKNTKKKVA